MTGPSPSVAAVRAAVRADLADLPAGALVLVACSGGPDSTALAVATAFVAPRLGLRAGLLTVDHGLQPGSDTQAERVVALGHELGLHPVDARRVDVRTGPEGPEAAARDARHRELEAAATRHGAAAVLLAHHRDDQAEQVLLGLARGSGIRSLAGIPPRRGHLRRPLLGLPREVLLASLEGRPVWVDPTNTDPRQTRARVRSVALPTLEAALGPGVSAALARTARQCRDDADLLDELAADAAERCCTDRGLDAARLLALPRALRTRVLRATCGGELSAAQVDAVEALVTDWHGQGPVALPGRRSVRRTDGALVLRLGADVDLTTGGMAGSPLVSPAQDLPAVGAP